MPWLRSQAGLSAKVKFQSFNLYGHGVQDLANCIAYDLHASQTLIAGSSPNGNSIYGSELQTTANQTFIGTTDPATVGTVMDRRHLVQPDDRLLLPAPERRVAI